MKTKIREQIQKLEQRRTEIIAKRDVADKLGHDAQCCLYSNLIKELNSIIGQLKEIVG